MPDTTALLTRRADGPAPAPDAAAPRRGRDQPTGAETRATAAGMRLLAAGVPLTLLLDLCLPVDSSAIAAAEGGSAAWMAVTSPAAGLPV